MALLQTCLPTYTNAFFTTCDPLAAYHTQQYHIHRPLILPALVVAMSAIKKVLAMVTPPTASTHSLPNGDAPPTPVSPNGTRSCSPSADGRRSSMDGGSTRESGRKPNRISTLLSHIRSQSQTREPEPHPNGVEHDETVLSHQIVRPSTQRGLSMTEEKIQRKEERDIKDEQEAEERRRKHLETWKNVRLRPLPAKPI